MKALRAILLAILLWVLIFVEISVLMIGLGMTGTIYYIIHYIFLIIFTIIIAWIYYKSKDRMNGFLLGIFLLLVGNILDLLITIPVFLKGDYLGFYSDPYMWVGFLIVIVTAGIYDLVRKK